MAKYVRTFDSFRVNKNENSINEELLGGVINFFKNMWNKAVEEIKKLGKNPNPEEIEQWIDKNPLNPQDDSYLLKGVMDEFNKKPEVNEQDCLDLVKNILDPQVGSLGKQGLQTLYDGLIKSFGKEVPTLDIVKYFIETIRNRAIKDYKYAGGPDLKVVAGQDAKVDDKKIIVDMKDTTHLPEFKKALLPAGQDGKKRKQLAIDWINKTLVPRLDKYLSEIKDEDVDKYIESVGKEVPEEGAGEFEVGDTVVYKREKFNKDNWDALTDDDKKKPEEGKMKELQNEEIGIKKVSKIEGDKVSFEDADFTKEKGDILMKIETPKAEGQEDLVKTLSDVKSKNPDAIKKLGDIAKLYQEPDTNKDKIAEIEKQLGGGEE